MRDHVRNHGRNPVFVYCDWTYWGPETGPRPMSGAAEPQQHPNSYPCTALSAGRWTLATAGTTGRPETRAVVWLAWLGTRPVLHGAMGTA